MQHSKSSQAVVSYIIWNVFRYCFLLKILNQTKTHPLNKTKKIYTIFWPTAQLMPIVLIQLTYSYIYPLFLQ